jgi:hypothetical protein
MLLRVDVEKSLQDRATTTTGDDAQPGPLQIREKRLLADDLPYRGRYELNLAALTTRKDGQAVPLILEKGDRLKLTLEVRDYRGEVPGESYLAEPLFLEIADVSDVIAANAKDDERADKSFEAIKNKILE